MSWRTKNFTASLLLAVFIFARTASGAEVSLWEIQKILAGKKYVDLTHSFAPGIPHWPGFPDEKKKTIYTYEKEAGMLGEGFFAEVFTLVGQWGTHLDAPAHFHKGLLSVDQLALKQMILPLVCLDVHEECERNPDYTLSVEQIKGWETRNGEIPAGAFVAMRSDWAKRWPDMNRMENKDKQGVAHYPGWSKEALQYLYEQRKVAASGHETTDTDPGIATTKDDYSLESYLLGTNHFQIELMTNLDQLPASGALIVIGVPKPKDGAGFPVRAFAILP